MSDEKLRKYFAKRSTFAISSAASTSSRIHKGDGFTLIIANKQLNAINAFSPPEKECSLAAFPGGCASISIPVSRILSGSVYLSEACPPPNK